MPWPATYAKKAPTTHWECSMTRTRKGSTGRIAFVGAGPGDPGLLTRRAHEALVSADHVVHDRNVRPERRRDLQSCRRVVGYRRSIAFLHQRDRQDFGGVLVVIDQEHACGHRAWGLLGGAAHGFGW